MSRAGSRRGHAPGCRTNDLPAERKTTVLPILLPGWRSEERQGGEWAGTRAVTGTSGGPPGQRRGSGVGGGTGESGRYASQCP